MFTRVCVSYTEMRILLHAGDYREREDLTPGQLLKSRIIAQNSEIMEAVISTTARRLLKVRSYSPHMHSSTYVTDGIHMCYVGMRLPTFTGEEHALGVVFSITTRHIPNGAVQMILDLAQHVRRTFRVKRLDLMYITTRALYRPITRAMLSVQFDQERLHRRVPACVKTSPELIIAEDFVQLVRSAKKSGLPRMRPLWDDDAIAVLTRESKKRPSMLMSLSRTHDPHVDCYGLRLAHYAVILTSIGDSPGFARIEP